LSPGERLPGTRRSLDGEDCVIEVGRDASRELHGGLTGLRFEVAGSKARRPTKEQLPGSSILRSA